MSRRSGLPAFFVVLAAMVFAAFPAVGYAQTPVLTSAPERYTSSTTATFAWTAPESVEGCRLDGGDNGVSIYDPSCSGGSITYPGLPDGDYLFYLYYDDGRVLSPFSVDTVAPEPPEFVLGAAADRFEVDGPADMALVLTTWQAGYGSTGIWRCTLNGQPLPNCGVQSQTVQYAWEQELNLAPGRYVFGVSAVDAAGNVSTATPYEFEVAVRPNEATTRRPVARVRMVRKPKGLVVLDGRKSRGSIKGGKAAAVRSYRWQLLASKKTKTKARVIGRKSVVRYRLKGIRRAGTYKLKLTVTDKRGARASKTVKLKVTKKQLRQAAPKARR